jgi:histidine triad (HIT) family protein
MSETIFSKIIRREIPADIVYEDDLILAFRDIQPQAPVHILVIPKQPIESIASITSVDQALLGHLLVKIQQIAAAANLSMAVKASLIYIFIFWDSAKWLGHRVREY